MPVGTNDLILIVVGTLFGYLLLATHYEQKRTTDRRKRNLGPPDGIERRSGKDRRRDSVIAYLGWVLRSQAKRLVGLFMPKPTEP